MVEPVFEDLAHAKTRGQGSIAFAKVDLGVGMGGVLARECGVSATPTFQFFLDKKKVCCSEARRKRNEDADFICTIGS